jgi:hypothetical protein
MKMNQEEAQKEDKDDEAKPMPSAGSYRKCLLGHQGMHTTGFSA